MALLDRSPEHVNAVVNDVAPAAHPADGHSVAENFAGDLTYIRNDALVANPAAILGSVFYERKTGGGPRLQQYLTGPQVEVDENSKLTSPLVRQEILVKRELAASLSVLSMLAMEGGSEDVFEFRVVDNAVARINTNSDEFRSALNAWLSQPAVQQFLAQPDVGRVTIAAGVVQKYVSRKKFEKYTGKVDGNGWGLNVGGQLFLSSSNYSLEILYGLDLLAFREVPADDAESVVPLTAEEAEPITSPQFETLRTRVTEDLSGNELFASAFSL